MPINPLLEPQSETRGGRTRRFALYGAAIGVLLGLAYLAAIDRGAAAEIIIWRRFLGAGLLAGAVSGWMSWSTPPGGDAQDR